MKNQSTFRLRIPESTLQELDLASQKTGLTRQNVCRMAVSLGLALLAKENYHIEPALRDRAEADSTGNPQLANVGGQVSADFPPEG